MESFNCDKLRNIQKFSTKLTKTVKCECKCPNAQPAGYTNMRNVLGLYRVWVPYNLSVIVLLVVCVLDPILGAPAPVGPAQGSYVDATDWYRQREQQMVVCNFVHVWDHVLLQVLQNNVGRTHTHKWCTPFQQTKLFVFSFIRVVSLIRGF